ncbi:MAG TPA: NRDE family protein [Thermoanaerobaculia bacterium]|nr:NRDE family protein [Thermoanaerobaculia bacterium]
MCLIVLAHRVSDDLPFVLAANRDEDYDRPTHDAHPWAGAEDIVGGRDALYGGSWLAVRRGGRFAAVTNLRGAERRKRSRGFLVRDFVAGGMDAAAYAETIARDANSYAGFHLFAGNVAGELMYITPEVQAPLEPGVHAFSNAPSDEQWPKTDYAITCLQNVLAVTNLDALVDELMRFLCTPRGTGAVESEVFLAGDRYGTRSSAVIVATRSEILFAEQTYARGGVALGDRRLFCLVR